ncbi:hypothetical protein SAMN05519104_7639 [Rhizobiales bacterium GAS188]|nr:hypothetical protein SAMN05519104_7639 [Rhizobiales bacterium GAS188]
MHPHGTEEIGITDLTASRILILRHHFPIWLKVMRLVELPKPTST